MAQDNKTWNENKQSINIPLIADVAKTATVTSETTGIGGFELTIREDESIKLENSITDYYAEDNSSLQDNIALKPLTFTIKQPICSCTIRCICIIIKSCFCTLT